MGYSTFSPFGYSLVAVDEGIIKENPVRKMKICFCVCETKNSEIPCAPS